MYPDAVSVAEEARLVRDAERWLARKSYERGHFDRVIEGYREVQKPLRAFSPGGRATLERLIAAVFPPSTSLLPVHVLDLEEDGYAAPVTRLGVAGRGTRPTAAP